MWIKREEYERLKIAEQERNEFAEVIVNLQNELAKTKANKRSRRSLGMVRQELEVDE